jgi:copper(I)-binding protein
MTFPDSIPVHSMKITLLATLLCSALPALAQVAVSEPWVRGTVPRQQATGAFMQLQASENSRLVAARSPVAGVVEIHEMAMEKDIMRMRALPKGLDLPAGKPIELKPGGFHVMLMDLKQQIKGGEVVPLTLVIEGPDKKQTLVEVKATVRALGAAAPTTVMHQH